MRSERSQREPAERTHEKPLGCATRIVQVPPPEANTSTRFPSFVTPRKRRCSSNRRSRSVIMLCRESQVSSAFGSAAISGVAATAAAAAAQASKMALVVRDPAFMLVRTVGPSLDAGNYRRSDGSREPHKSGRPPAANPTKAVEQRGGRGAAPGAAARSDSRCAQPCSGSAGFRRDRGRGGRRR